MDDNADIDIIPNSGNTYRDILMNQFSKVTGMCNVEFRGGFWTKIPIKGGEEKLIYVPDTRETFCNGTMGLAIILRPRFDKKMRESFKTMKKLLKGLQKEFMDKSIVKESVILGENFYTDEKDKIALEEYRNKKLALHLSLFSRLNKEMNRLNYLEISGATFI